MRLALLTLAAFGGICSADAQNWTSQRIGGLSAEEATARYARAFPRAMTKEIKSGVQLFKASYSSSDGITQRKVTGLVALPERGAPAGLVVYFQGTNLERALSPSRYTGANQNASIEDPVLAFCLAGFAVAIPDTFGLGDDMGTHPYPLGSVNCQTGIDLVPIARSIARAESKPTGDRLFVTGYSEGGGTAMWMVRKLEAAGQTVTAAAPMSGPYDLKGTMLDWILGNSTGIRNLAFKFVAASYGGVGIGARTGMKLDAMLAPSYASYVPFVFGQNLTTEEIGKKLTIKGFEFGAFRSIVRVLQPEFKRQLRERDVQNPFVKAFAENDIYAWTPRTPMILPYLPSDEIVPATNTLLAASYMESTGTARPMGLTGNGLDHVTAARPALMMTARYFSGGFDAVDRAYPTLAGSAAYMERIAMPSTAVLTVSLLDITHPERTVKLTQTTRFFGPRQVPIPFRLSYDARKIVLGRHYGLVAEIRDRGKVLFETASPAPFRVFGGRLTGDTSLVLKAKGL